VIIAAPDRGVFAQKGRYSMASKKTAVELIAMQCTECKRRNYTTSKNRKNTQEKLELKKYCKWDKKHTLHKETKIK
jgi:large subunit ribosomal protein L33